MAVSIKAHRKGLKGSLTQTDKAKILALKEGMNSQRVHVEGYQPDHAKLGSPNYVPLDPNYISGFVTGDGHFSLTTNVDLKTFGTIQFGVSQHINNKLLLDSFPSILGIKDNTFYKTKKMYSIMVTKNETLRDIILPYFDKYPLAGKKAKTFLKIMAWVMGVKEKKNEGKKQGRWTKQLKQEVLDIWQVDITSSPTEEGNKT